MVAIIFVARDGEKGEAQHRKSASMTDIGEENHTRCIR